MVKDSVQVITVNNPSTYAIDNSNRRPTHSQSYKVKDIIPPLTLTLNEPKKLTLLPPILTLTLILTLSLS